MSAEPKPTDSVVSTIAKTMNEGKMTQLAPNRFMLAEHAHQTWVANPEPGTPPEALLDHKYWAHYSVNPNLQMKPGDIILAKPDDGAFFMELLVRSLYRGGVHVVELRRKSFDKLDMQPGEDFGEYEVKYSGPRYKWNVVRKADKQRMTEGHELKDGAIAWLREHMKAFS